MRRRRSPPACLLLCLSTDIADIALRTDLVGSLFLSLTLLALTAPKAFRSLARLAPGGLALGLAMVTKQNFAFAGLAVIVWLLLCDPVRSWPQARLFLLRAAVFGICALPALRGVLACLSGPRRGR